MKANTTNDGWVYVFVNKSGPKESFVGLYDEEQKVNFIPAFQTKDDANECYLSLPRAKGDKYEVQAVHIEELQDEAAQNEFIVAIVDKDGKIIK